MKALLRGMDSVYDAERREDYIRFQPCAPAYTWSSSSFVLLLSFFVMVYGGQHTATS